MVYLSMFVWQQKKKVRKFRQLHLLHLYKSVYIKILQVY